MNDITQNDENVNNKPDKLPLSSSPFCQTNCKICNSGHSEIVGEKIREGMSYLNIVSYLQNNYNCKISTAGITRHWKNYKRALVEHGKQRELERFDDEADDLLRHQKQVTQIADGMYNLIVEKIESGTLDVSVADYAQLVKIRHGVLTGDSGSMNDLVGIFQQATSKYGVNLNQGVLFKKKNIDD